MNNGMLLWATQRAAGLLECTVDGPGRTDAVDWAFRRVYRDRWNAIKETGRDPWANPGFFQVVGRARRRLVADDTLRGLRPDQELVIEDFEGVRRVEVSLPTGAGKL
jgi:hypothetical protein